MADTATQASGERWLIAARLSRMSKKDQARPELITGIATQDQRSAEWASGEGHAVVHVTRDKNVSGSISPWKRPELGPWLTDPALIDRYDGIVAYEASRVSRDYADLPMLRKWAEEHGKKLYVVKDRLAWPDNRDGMLWAVAAERAYQERQDTIERTTRELNALRAAGKLAGKYPWGFASTGDKYDRRMIATAQGSRYVPEAFQRIADGETLTAVAAWLSQETGHDWHPRVIAAMIRNRAYRGEYVTAGGKCVHKCPPLVDGDLWRRANASLSGRPSSRRGQRNDLATPAALMAGLATCGNPDCDAAGREFGPSPMYKISPPGREPAYRCSGRGSRRKGCGNLVPLAAADTLLDAAMSGMVSPVMRPVFHAATGHQTAIDDITMQLRDLPARGLDDDAEDAERAILRAERKRLEGLPASPAWTEFLAVLDDDGEILTHGARWARSNPAQRRAWLEEAGFVIELGKPEFELPDPSQPGDSLARMDCYEDDSALVVFRWTGDDDAGLGRGLPSVEMAD